MAVLYTFLFLFRYESIPYLGGRISFALLACVGLFWFVWLIVEYYKVLPHITRQEEIGE
jgi:hypothetical protein